MLLGFQDFGLVRALVALVQTIVNFWVDKILVKIARDEWFKKKKIR